MNSIKFTSRPDLPDHRDKLFESLNLPATQSTSFTLRDKFPAVWNQESLNSCTAQAMCACLQFYDPSVSPSRLFLY